MRIAFIGHKRLPSREGGVEVVVDELATRMAARGAQVTAYSRRGRHVAGARHGDALAAGRRPYDHRGVRVVPVCTIDAKGLAAVTSSFCATIRAIAARPDVIHYHAEGPCVMLRLAHLAGIRTVATIHGLDWRRAKWGRLAGAVLRLGERTAASCADEVIVLSRDMQRYFLDTYGRRTRLVPNGVERGVPARPRLIAERYGLPANGYLLFLGRIVPEKGVHRLIEAFGRLDTAMRLVIAGGPSDSAAYYDAIRQAAAADPRITLTGFVQGDELRELYANAYLVVLPSDLEGMPMGLLEALSFDRCCLTSDIPECAALLGGHGVTFRRGDVDDLTAKLAALVADPDAVAAMGAGAADDVTARYSWDAVVDRTMALYEGDPGQDEASERGEA